SSPSSGFSAAKTTRKGAPFHGSIGEGKTASSSASAQAPVGPWACESTTEKSTTKNTPAISNHAVTAPANWRAGDNSTTPFRTGIIAKAWLNHGRFHRQANSTVTSSATVLHFAVLD